MVTSEIDDIRENRVNEPKLSNEFHVRCEEEEAQIIDSYAEENGFMRLKKRELKPDRSKAIRKIIREFHSLKQQNNITEKSLTLTNGGKQSKKPTRLKSTVSLNFEGKAPSVNMPHGSYSLIEDPYGLFC